MGLIRCSGRCLEGQLSLLDMRQPHRVPLPSWVEARCVRFQTVTPSCGLVCPLCFSIQRSKGGSSIVAPLWRKIRPPSLAKAVGTLHSSL